MKPRRQYKSDRLMTPGASTEEIRCDFAVAPFDREALAMDRKWGVDALPELVSTETAARFGSAMAKLNAAMESADPDETAARAAVCIRGLQAMDAEATAAGHKPADPDIWIGEVEGRKFGIIRDGREWPAAHAKADGMTIYSMQEIAAILADYESPAVREVKRQFPGADVTRVRTPIEKALNDEIPF